MTSLGVPTAVSAPRSGKRAAGLFQGRRLQRTFWSRLSPICGHSPDSPFDEEQASDFRDGKTVYIRLSPICVATKPRSPHCASKLPKRRYCGKLRPSYHRTPWDMRRLFVVDPLVVESFLHSNRECLRGYPPTAEAFVDLVRSVWVEETNPLGTMITMAFSQRGLYGPRRAIASCKYRSSSAKGEPALSLEPLEWIIAFTFLIGGYC